MNPNQESQRQVLTTAGRGAVIVTVAGETRTGLQGREIFGTGWGNPARAPFSGRRAARHEPGRPGRS